MKAAKSLFVFAIFGSAAWVGKAPALMGPHFIMLSGGPLTERVMITDASELMRLTCALDGGEPVTETALKDRSFVQVSAFWGGPWQTYWTNPKWPAGIRAEDAGQQGRYYPAADDRPAMFLGTPMRIEPTPVPTTPSSFAYLRLLSADCIALFEKYLEQAENRSGGGHQAVEDEAEEGAHLGVFQRQDDLVGVPNQDRQERHRHECRCKTEQYRCSESVTSGGRECHTRNLRGLEAARTGCSVSGGAPPASDSRS